VLSIVTGLCLSSTLSASVYAQRSDVIKFIDEISTEHNIDKSQALNALSKVEKSDEIIKRMTTQYEALPWHKYQAMLVTDKKIQGGTKFWREYAEILKQAEKEFGVPAQLIVAIIGVESSYGDNSGKYPVLQALATLAFDYPPRADFFKNELKEYLLLITEQKLDPLALKGSYAGAMGMPQFIASSYRNFAVDFDNSGQIDLHNNIPQVIGSVANYFKVHGWKSGEPVIHKAKVKGNKYKNLQVAARNNPVPAIPLQIVKEHGITPVLKIKDPKTPIALLEFNNGKETEYWLGLNNFYVITRYNNSSNYALAVHQLGDAIKKSYKP
jgi:membrane-bound lytic murein transglycosylase B